MSQDLIPVKEEKGGGILIKERPCDFLARGMFFGKGKSRKCRVSDLGDLFLLA